MIVLISIQEVKIVTDFVSPHSLGVIIGHLYMISFIFAHSASLREGRKTFVAIHLETPHWIATLRSQ